jgi:hypothetical protein
MAQNTTGTLQGTVTDQSGAAVPNANITIQNPATGLERTIKTDAAGIYLVPSLPLGSYVVQVTASGLQSQKATGVQIAVATATAQNFSLKVASGTETVEVTGEAPVIESTTSAVSSTIDQKTVQEIPLNGRHFVDLALLTPGTVVPPANGFLTAPLRGQGAFGIVSAGTREDTTNFMVNGVNLNDSANGQLTFNPTIATVQEFKINNQTPSAEYGRNLGAQVNIATRSGTNNWHGEGYEFLRNEDFDARNFFNKEFDTKGNKLAKNPFKRNQFGGDFGGPIWKNHTFFYFSYEGLRQRQGLALSSNVPSSAQRATVTDPTVKQLLALIPAGVDPVVPNSLGPGVTSKLPASFSGSAVAPVDIDQETLDMSHDFSQSDRLHGYYVFQRDIRKEPNSSGATIPGGGDTRQSHRQIFTLNETHVFTPNTINDFRFGLNRIHILFSADVQNAGLDPTTFGINDGLSGPIGLPQFSVGGTGLVFGGERNFPQGRGDLTTVVNDTVSHLRGKHAFKFGGEYRRINNNTIAADEGSVSFSNLQTFLGCGVNAAGDFINCGQSVIPTTFAVNLGGSHPARITQPALGFFAMDNWKITQYLSLELGMRWDWNFTPTEARNRSSLFLPGQDWLAQLGTNGVNEEYHQNNKLFQPRVGFAYDMFHNTKTVLRGGYAIAYDQPLPIISSGNPPFGVPVSFTTPKNTTRFSTLITDAQGGGLTPATADPNYNDAYIQSYNLNIQQEITPSLGMMIGYFGSKATHLNTQLNLNQLVQDPTQPLGVYVRPFKNLAANSPVLPSSPLGNITANESIGTSTYNGLWITGTKRMGHGVTFNANYTWSHSIDENSRNFQGVVVQNSLNPFADKASSDFDARHHFTFSGLYALPFNGNRLKEGWQIGTIITLQSGNPLNITAGSPTTGTAITGFTGVGSIRPDLTGAIPATGITIITNPADPNPGAIQYFASATTCDPTRPSSCTGSTSFALPFAIVGGRNVFHFGNLGRNAILGPDFKDMDFSISKRTKITEHLSHELRVESFDLFNHPNFGNPGLSAAAGSTSFGVIRATRNPTGDAGSSRQFQFAMKLIF